MFRWFINLVNIFFILLIIATVIFSKLVESNLPNNEVQTIGLENATNVGAKIYEDHLQTSSILYGLTKVAAASKSKLLTEQCLKELGQIQQGILRKEPWAIKVLDSSASKPPGFIFQHNFWLGNSAACAVAYEPLNIVLYKPIRRTMKPGLFQDLAPFAVDFRVVYLRHNSPWQIQVSFATLPILHLGLCLPVSCSTRDIHRLTQEFMQPQFFAESNFYEFRPEVLYVKDLKLAKDFFEKRSLKIIATMLIFSIVMMLWANRSKMPITEVKEKSGTKEANIQVTREQTSACETNEKPESRNYLQMLPECFNIDENCKRLFTLREYTPQDIPVINGMRTILALGVLCGHVAWFARYTVSNGSLVVNAEGKATFRAHQLGLYSVDAFFTISGFLLTFSLLGNMKIIRNNSFIQNVQLFFNMLCHRYLRLGPLYLITICAADLVWAYLNDVSLFHIYERCDENCTKNWWQNMFFIQTYFSFTDMCIQWSWSLSCEMQYFLLATILFFIYIKYPKLAAYAVGGLMVSSIGYTIYKGIIHKYQFAPEAIYSTLGSIYIQPMVRITTYIIGCLAAWYLVTQQQQQHQHNFNPVIEKLFVNMPIILIVGSAYTIRWQELDYLVSISLYTLGRFMMSIGICWIIVGSKMGCRCWWSRILETKIFQHLNRLTYAAYLVNPLIVMLFSGLTQASPNMDLILLISWLVSYTILTYIFSIGFFLAFEVPYCNFSRMILKKQGDKFKKT